MELLDTEEENSDEPAEAEVRLISLYFIRYVYKAIPSLIWMNMSLGQIKPWTLLFSVTFF